MIDEIHKYAKWPQEVKNLYYSSPAAKIFKSITQERAQRITIQHTGLWSQVNIGWVSSRHFKML
jgi:hypothetical protein